MIQKIRNRFSTLPFWEKGLLVATLVFVLVFSGTKAQAAYAVHDAKIYAQVVEQLKKAKEMLSNAREQLEYVILDHTGLEQSVFSKLEDHTRYVDDYLNNQQQRLSKVIAGVSDAKESIAENFVDFRKYENKNIRLGDLAVSQRLNAEMVEENRSEILARMNLIQQAQVDQKKRIDILDSLNRNPKGEKQVLQIQNEYRKEELISQRYTNELQSLQTKLQLLEEQKKTIDQQNEAIALKNEAKDFKDWAKKQRDEQSKKTNLNIFEQQRRQ